VRILIVGNGGREHALAWQFAQSGHQVLAAPGNPGIAGIGRCLKISVGNVAAIAEAAEREAVDLVVIGPEAPLVDGFADRLRELGVPVFGPGADGARLEGSKAFAKEFFRRHGIPTPAFEVCDGAAAAREAVVALGGALVIKADGLAGGKGVIVCDEPGQALEAIDEIAVRFGEASQTILVERRLSGREVSLMAVCDGKRIELMAPAEDHKQLRDGDVGPNTGGMGAVSPVDWVTDELIERARGEIFDPTVAGLAAEGIDYRGVLYAGLMVEEDGAPQILEYNCRFGDPEVQSLVRRIRGDLARTLAGAAAGALPKKSLGWDSRVAVGVVMAGPGYPGAARTGIPVDGLEDLGDDVVVFHAGTQRQGSLLFSSGGRVLTVTALGASVREARARAYAAVDRIEFDGAELRRDIGARKTS
jgi:phosphoribosylamine--glycine ligase